MRDALEKIPAGKRRILPLEIVFQTGNFAMLHMSYEPLMDSAIQLMRGRIVDNRAEAIEVAYDALLRSSTDGKWRRVGEVHLNRREKKTTALCIEDDPHVLAGIE